MASLSYLCVCTLMLRMCRPCLARLHERLQDRLRPEPCQIGSTPLAPAPEPRKIRSLEHFSVGGATKSWLHPAPSDSTASNASPAPDGHAADGRPRQGRGSRRGGWPVGAHRGGGSLRRGGASRRENMEGRPMGARRGGSTRRAGTGPAVAAAAPKAERPAAWDAERPAGWIWAGVPASGLGGGGVLPGRRRRALRRTGLEAQRA